MPLELLKRAIGSLLPRPVSPDAEMVEIEDRADVSTTELLRALEAEFPVRLTFINIRMIDSLFPPPEVTIRRRFRLEPEGDKKFANRAIIDFHRREIPVMHVRERIVFERLFFAKYQRHPDDQETASLCPAPPTKIGAKMFCKEGQFCICWCSSTDRDPMLLARRAFPVSSRE